MFRLDEDTTVVHQPESGLVRASAANAAHRALAASNGATLVDRTRVIAVEPNADGFTVVTGDHRIDVDRLIVTADAWTNEVVAGLGWEVNLVVTQEQVAYFDAAPGLGPMPVWIWMDDPSFYGLPGVDGSGPKIGQDVGGAVVTGDDRSFQPDPAYRERLVRFQEQLLPATSGTVVEERTCLYTMTPDREFVLDHVPGHEGAVVGLGAAHGFKFAGVFGKVLAELAIDGTTGHDVAGWPATRPILTEPDPVMSFLL
jgi:sarcosine oxidase